jgi:predicted ATPase/class 3 adenylate cyclase
VVTLHFLFSDIEGSTLLWDTHPEAMKVALALHDEQMRNVVEVHDGVLFKNTGDGAAAVFDSAVDALEAAADAQRELSATEHPGIGVLKARMAVHSGAAERRDGDYFGPPLNRAARLMAAAHGGQVLVSLVAERLAEPPLPGDLVLRDLGEFPLRDFPRPETVFQLMGDGLTVDFPPLRTRHMVPHNLPIMSSSFVGRDLELKEVGELINDARLVTLTGVGGAGKTRLALQVAAAVSPEFADGVWFVGLGAVTDPARVLPQAADALRIQEQPGTPLGETLLEYLVQKEALLIVDNCEHLISAVAESTATLLAAAPSCRVLATSRELLNVDGEVAYRLRPMSLPDDASNLTPTELGRYDAVQLFIERATAAKPDFIVTPDTALAIAEICRRLDGIPLAIELAAARIRTYTSQQIANILEQNFRMLTGGSRTADARQQTLAGAIDWSYRLLGDREKQLFERLSVFQGGFDLGAAREVCSTSPINEYDVLELLPALVDKSLIVVDDGREEARYRVLEMLRQFGRDRLDESGETELMRQQHATHYMTLAEEFEPNVRGENEKEWRDRINLELDNLRLAMDWSLAAGKLEIGMRLAGAIWRFWKVSFRYSEGVRWLNEMYEAGTDVDDAVRAKVMLGLGTLKSYADDPAAAGVLLGRSIEIYRQLEAQGVEPALLRHVFPSALISLATNIWQYDQDFERATELWNEALEVGWRVGDGAGVSIALGNLAEAAARTGAVEEARRGYSKSIEASYAFNSAHSTVEAICLAAVFELSVSQPARAEALFDDAVDLARSAELDFWVNFGQTMRAVAAHDLGQSGTRELFKKHAAKLFANAEFQSTFYYQLPLLLCGADVEHRAGHSDRAARLLGVLEKLEEEHSPLEPIFEGTRRSRLTQDLVSELGRAGFQHGLTKGRALPRHEVTKLIVDD